MVGDMVAEAVEKVGAEGAITQKDPCGDVQNLAFSKTILFCKALLRIGQLRAVHGSSFEKQHDFREGDQMLKDKCRQLVMPLPLVIGIVASSLSAPA
jgi:hypothetical protein